jgi:undecaprenyl-diphosphatase
VRALGPSPISSEAGAGGRATSRETAAYQVVAIVSIVLYVALTACVAAGLTLDLDTRLMLAVAAQRRPWFLPIMRVVTDVGGGAVALPLALLMVYALRRHGRIPEAKAYAVTALGGWAVYALAKLSLGRPRPHVIPYLYGGAGWYSYPSGHSTLAVIVFGLAAVLWSDHWESNARRAGLIGLALLVSLAIGFSRIYLGVHYPSDVLGGLLLGTAWSSFWLWWWGTSEAKRGA